MRPWSGLWLQGGAVARIAPRPWGVGPVVPALWCTLLVFGDACTHKVPAPARSLPLTLPAEAEVWLRSPPKNCHAEVEIKVPVFAPRWRPSVGPGDVVADWDRGPPVTCTLYSLPEGWFWVVAVESSHPSMEDEIAARGFPAGFRDAHPEYQWGDTPPERRRFACNADRARSPWIHIVGPDHPHLAGEPVGLTDTSGKPLPLSGAVNAFVRCDVMGG